VAADEPGEAAAMKVAASQLRVDGSGLDGVVTDGRLE
jgi:hypothetical protein